LDSAEKNGRPVAPEKAQQILKTAIAEREAELEAEYERRRQAKRKRVPTPPGDGKTATHTADLSDEQQRIAWMTEQYNALNADS
jgi:aminoglycoside phosphotransferase